MADSSCRRTGPESRAASPAEHRRSHIFPSARLTDWRAPVQSGEPDVAQTASSARHGARARDLLRPKTKAVILAAGLGTRMKSRTPRVLHEICGRPMLAYVIEPRAMRPATHRWWCTRLRRSRSARYLPAGRFRDPGSAARHRATPSRAALEALPDDIEEIVVLSRRRAAD